MTSFFKSIAHAMHGIRDALDERNFRIEVLAGCVVMAAAFMFPTSRTQKALLALSIAFVLGTEIVNTAIEHLADIVSPDHRAEVRIVKDLMAAAVLVVSIGAAIAGLYIFFML